MEIINIPQCESTNAEIARLNPPHGTALFTHTQTAGRGQRGNSWESEPGKNLTFSILLRPTWLKPIQQFAISQAVCLAIVSVLRKYLPHPDDIKIKWPNDIYSANRKICGILIENTIAGNSLARSIAGIGINVNQTQFLSDAPNPISMAQIAGHHFPLPTLAHELVAEITERIHSLHDPDGITRTANLYFNNLWRLSGLHPYRNLLTGQQFNAEITAVLPTGHIVLKTDRSQTLTFAFKEMAPIIQ